MSDKPTNLKFESGNDERILMHEIANKLLDFCCENGVSLVANQKVFDSKFVDLFLKNGILVLPRIGTQGICQLKSMTKSAFVLTSIRQLHQKCKNNESRVIFERELALLVALQGESSWKGVRATVS